MSAGGLARTMRGLVGSSMARLALIHLLALLMLAAPLRSSASPEASAHAVSAIDGAIQPGALPPPSTPLPRAPICYGPRASETESPAWSVLQRCSLFVGATAGLRALVRTRPLRHVPRMGSSDPDLT